MMAGAQNNNGVGVPRKMNFPGNQKQYAAPGAYDQQDGGSFDPADMKESPPSITLPSGAKYTGQWLNGMKDGLGYQIWPDGSKYQGDWQSDQANGFGKLVHADGDVYEGQWRNDKAHGQGSYTHANGATYVGEWLDDK